MGSEALRVYQVVELQVGQHNLLARIRGLSTEEITVEPMGWSEAEPLLREGADVKVFFAGVDALFCLPTSIRTIVHEPVHRLYLERRDDAVARIQRRQHFRVDVQVRVRYGLPGSPDETAEPGFEGHTRDFSAGGVLLEVDEVRAPTTLLHLVMDLPDGAEPMSVVGRVVRAGEAEGWDASPLLGVEFVALTEEDRSRITRLLFTLRDRGDEDEAPSDEKP